MRRLAWFSCGAASAVAAKLAVETYGANCEVVYCDTMATEHEDNPRFFADAERWVGRSFTVIRSTRYATVDEVFEKRRYMSGRDGAICTSEMKKAPREAFQYPDDVHLFGYTYEEQDRAERFEKQNPSLACEWILIDQFVTKAECKRRLREAGIPLPAMYALDFDHNNCKGCVKSQSPGYWNRTRRHFPAVFQRRGTVSRNIGCRLVRIGIADAARIEGDAPEPTYKHGLIDGYRIFLDQLPSDIDAPDDAIDCGPACQMPLLPEAA